MVNRAQRIAPTTETLRIQFVELLFADTATMAIKGDSGKSQKVATLKTASNVPRRLGQIAFLGAFMVSISCSFEIQ